MDKKKYEAIAREKVPRIGDVICLLGAGMLSRNQEH